MVRDSPLTRAPVDQRGLAQSVGLVIMAGIVVVLVLLVSVFIAGMSGPDYPPMNVTTDVEGAGSPTATVTLTDLGEADGIAITNDSGQVVENGVVTATGNSVTYSNATAGITPPANLTVSAYNGSVAHRDDLEATASDSAVVEEFSLEP
jgi:hypothetical protein